MPTIVDERAETTGLNHSNARVAKRRQARQLRRVGLIHVSDQDRGIRRVRRGRGFSYVGLSGRPLRDQRILERIRKLAIPPAYEDVWICRDANGHLQATGRDARGRKQYRYHPLWRELRDHTKYDRLLDFADALPALRKRVDADLRQQGLGRDKVLASVVRLLETALIRVGNQRYADENRAYGLTTLRGRHVNVHGGRLRFAFRGKSGQPREVVVDDRRLAGIVKRLQDLPGQSLFQYLDDEGKRHTISSSDVNDYLRDATESDFTAKDFRTWAGTLLAAHALAEANCGDSEHARRAVAADVMRAVAKRLGNTAAVCRKCYVHPAVLDAWMAGDYSKLMQRARAVATRSLSDRMLEEDERVVHALLETLGKARRPAR